MKSTKLLLLTSCVLINGCGGTIEIPDIEACAVAGIISAGSDCATTLSGRTRSMSMSDTLNFLEPNEKKAAGIFMSAVDFNKLKTALEKACEILGSDCTREVKEALQKADASIAALMKKAEKRRHDLYDGAQWSE